MFSLSIPDMLISPAQCSGNPTVWCSSNMATFTPFLAALRAAIAPAGPQPMTITSNFFLLEMFHPVLVVFCLKNVLSLRF